MKTKVLIAVKTYPSLSQKYDELVCTAGFREDGSWIRIYPVPYRKLEDEKQYQKWQWIEIDLVKRIQDFRPESYRPISHNSDIKIIKKVGTENNWSTRKTFALKNVYTDMSLLIADAKDKNKCISLATLKPKKILDFIIEPTDRDWDKRKIDAIKSNRQQLKLFDGNAEKVHDSFNVVKKLPYKFSYKFTTDDNQERKIMIEDWELGVLYCKMIELYQNEAIACQKVKEKYFDTFTTKNDIYFFMGTSLAWQSRNAPNPFMIIGVFYPPQEDKYQLSLF